MLVSLHSGIARSEPDARGFTLEWHGACDGAAATLDRLTQLLGGDPALRSEPPLAVSATVTETETALEVVIATRQGAGQFRREFVSENCSDAIEATALILGVAIDPELEVEPPAPASEPSAAASEPPAAAPAPPAKSPERAPLVGHVRSRSLRFEVREESDEARQRWSITASGLLMGRVLPASGFGVELGVGFESGPAAFEARGFWLSPRREMFSDSSNEGADIGAWGGALQGGARWLSVGPLRASAHGAVWYALQVAEAVGTPGRNSGRAGWLAATAGVSGSLPWGGSTSLFVRGDAGAALARPRFLIENRELFQSPVLVVAGALGARFRF